MTIQDETSSRNAWRLETPGAEGWPRSARPGAPNKYFMVSADCHVTESLSVFDGVPAEYRERIPHPVTRDDGSVVLITEGNRPQRVKGGASGVGDLGGSAGGAAVSGASPMEGEDVRRNAVNLWREWLREQGGTP